MTDFNTQTDRGAQPSQGVQQRATLGAQKGTAADGDYNKVGRSGAFDSFGNGVSHEMHDMQSARARAIKSGGVGEFEETQPRPGKEETK